MILTTQLNKLSSSQKKCFDDMATLEDMGLKPTSGEASAADAERCQVPAFAKAIGHEETWKQHNGCS